MGGREYYYLVAKRGNGQLVVAGPHEDRSTAETLGLTKLDVPYEIVALNTKDRSRATSIIKKRRLDAGDGLDESISPASHLPSRKPANSNPAQTL